MFIDYLETPLGAIEIQATDKGVAQVMFSGAEKKKIKISYVTHCCKEQLVEYFKGARKKFDLTLDPQGTEFQKSVWDCLLKIPFGKTLSYRDIADMINNPKAVRAVGGANGRNPISIILPCHRVVGANGALTGYAGGVERKLWLLKHESNGLGHLNGFAKLDIRNAMHSRQAKTQFLK